MAKRKAQSGIDGLEGLIVNDLFDYFEPNKKYDNLVFLDVETTGFDCVKDRIIELAVVQVTAVGIIRQEDVYVRLPEGRRIPGKIVELTGITDQKLVTDGVPETQAARILGSMLHDDSLVIAYNAEFDLSFLGMMYLRQLSQSESDQAKKWMQAFGNADYLDPMTIYKDRRAKPHKLKSAISTYHLGDQVQNSHRAIDDVMALMEVTKAMSRERDDLLEYVNIFGVNPGLGLGGGRKFKKVRYVKQPSRSNMCRPENILPRILEKEGEYDFDGTAGHSR